MAKNTIKIPLYILSSLLTLFILSVLYLLSNNVIYELLFIKKNSKINLEIINGQFKLFIAHYNIILLIIKNID